MLDPTGLLSVSLAFLIVTVSPGPANIAVAAIAMSSGRRSGLVFGAGLSLGLAAWGVVAASGLGAVLQASASALVLLKIVGGLYLLWLAYASGRSAMTGSAERVASPGTGFRRGLILNLSNPKAVVAWMAALSMGLGAGDGAAQLLVATLVCMTIGVLNYTGYALAFSLKGAMRLYRRLRRWIEGIVAGLFALAGLSLLRSALTR